MVLRKITWKAKASVIEAPAVINEQIIAAFTKASVSEGVNQEDLLHVRSTLVTSGTNRNRDFFLKNELWAARKTPLHKPSDWDHDRRKIIGHIYRVEARTIDGQELDREADQPTLLDGTPYDGDFELIVDKVVYAALLPEYAEAIQRLSSEGLLHVSMEAWFDDYDFVTWTDASELPEARLADEIEFELHPREENKEWEEKLVTSGKGAPGKLEDGRCLGRALKSIIFGGVGYVGVPANPRSDIHLVSGRTPATSILAKIDDNIYQGKERSEAAEKGDGWTHKYTVGFSIFGEGHTSDANIYGEVIAQGGVEVAMKALKENVFPRLSKLIEAVTAEMDIDKKLNPTPWYKSINAIEDEKKVMYSCSFEFEREPEPEEEEEESQQDTYAEKVTADLVADNVQEVDMNADLQKLQSELEELKTENARLKKEQSSAATAAEEAARIEKVDALLKTIATPVEIARIDDAIQSGQDPFEAKLAFITQARDRTSASMVELQNEIEKFRLRDRLDQVKALNLYTDEKLEKVRESIAKMDDEAFAEWIEERQEFADKIAAATASESEEPEADELEEPAAKAIAALENAEPEEEPNLADTKAEDAPADGKSAEEKDYEDLAAMVSNSSNTDRIKRLRKLRGDQFGR